MKKFIVLIFVLLPFFLHAQIETAINIGSGFSYFTGSETVKFATVNYLGDIAEDYGRTPGISYHFSFDLTKHPKADFLYGLGVSYDISRTVMKIKTYRDSFRVEMPLNPEDKALLIMHNFGLAPFIGQRFSKNYFVLDIRFKAEFINPLYVIDKSKFTLPNDVDVAVNNRRNSDLFDFRLCTQINAFHKKTAWFISYSLGFINYNDNQNSKDSVKSRQLNSGISYRFIN